MMGDKDLANVIFEGFLQVMPTQLQQLSKSAHEELLEEIEKQAHKVKGAAANLSAQRLQHSALAIEHAARTRELDQIKPLIDELNHNFYSLKPLIENAY